MSGAADFFRRLQQQLSSLEQEIAQVVVAVEAENFHSENFRKEGFTDVGFQPWPPRKKQERPRRALLVKTGALKGHALKGRRQGSQVDFIFPLPYMRVHNEGGKAGRGKGFQMPKRQYVGRSNLLEDRIRQKATIIINRRLNRL